MAEPAHAFEVPVGNDGELVVPADELARHGVGPGDTVRIQPLPTPRIAPEPGRLARASTDVGA